MPDWLDNELERSNNPLMNSSADGGGNGGGPTRWGLVGASTIARQWMVDAIRAQPHNEVIGVVSGSPQRARSFAGDMGLPQVYDRLDDLLADPRIDAIYISTTNEQHFQQVLAAAAAGKHVLCEKPLALTIEDAVTMARACRDAGVVMATNHHLRNAATHRRIRELVQGGDIGRPLFARVFHAVHLPAALQGWRVDNPGAGGGVILDITVHDADTLRFILGAEPVEVTALPHFGAMSRRGLEDGVMAVLRFDNDVLAQLHDAFTVQHAGTGIEIHGDAGSIIGRDVMTQRPVGDVILRTASGERAVPVEHENLYVRGVAAFCAAMAGEGPPAATAEDGIRSLATALAVAESCRSRAVVRIPDPLI